MGTKDLHDGGAADVEEEKETEGRWFPLIKQSRIGTG
jgi:hypothetical protein